jgi:hypothetical protein
VSTTMDIYCQVLPGLDENVAKDLGALFKDRSVGSPRESDHAPAEDLQDPASG